ncbi:hypothetical protein BDV18DRAFT_2409 [Aspergillus unguis]
MPARAQSRITTACNSCRTRKQKCSGNRPKCIQGLNHRRDCDWPEQLKRGPAKGYIDALERRLQETENILLGLLQQVTDDQVSNSIQDYPAAQPARPDTEYWKLFPLRSVQEVRAWQGDFQQKKQASTSTSTPNFDHAELVAPTSETNVPGPPATHEVEEQIPEPQLSVSMWSGAPSANFQQQFLW